MLFQLKFYGAALARYKMPPGVSKMLGCVTRGSDERANYVTHKKKNYNLQKLYSDKCGVFN